MKTSDTNNEIKPFNPIRGVEKYGVYTNTVNGPRKGQKKQIRASIDHEKVWFEVSENTGFIPKRSKLGHLFDDLDGSKTVWLSDRAK